MTYSQASALLPSGRRIVLPLRGRQTGYGPAPRAPDRVRVRFGAI